MPERSWSHETLPCKRDYKQDTKMVINSLAILPAMQNDATGPNMRCALCFSRVRIPIAEIL
jgi:hypothetical protein